MGEHFVIDIDDIPTYLGTILMPHLGRFMLPLSTYVLKWACPERDFSFKTYPNLGYVERRKTFSEYGDPIIPQRVIPFEDTLLDHAGHPFHEIVVDAIKERQQANATGTTILPEMVTDKEYLMSSEQQVASGMFWGLPPNDTRRIVLKIVGDNIKDKLTFK